MSKHPLFWLPNALTVSRCVMSFFVAWTIFIIARHEASLVTDIPMPVDAAQAHAMISVEFRQRWATIGFIVFALSAFTDWLDGALARRWQVESAFGRLLDPIADKLIVGLPLIAMAWASGWALPVTLPAFVIVIRDAFITTLRFAGLGASTMAVSYIAKFKTFLEMILVALFLAAMAFFGPVTPLIMALLTTWLFALWGVAALSAWTGFTYLLRLRVRTKPAEISD